MLNCLIRYNFSPKNSKNSAKKKIPQNPMFQASVKLNIFVQFARSRNQPQSGRSKTIQLKIYLSTQINNQLYTQNKLLQQENKMDNPQQIFRNKNLGPGQPQNPSQNYQEVRFTNPSPQNQIQHQISQQRFQSLHAEGPNLRPSIYYNKDLNKQSYISGKIPQNQSRYNNPSNQRSPFTNKTLISQEQNQKYNLRPLHEKPNQTIGNSRLQQLNKVPESRFRNDYQNSNFQEQNMEYSVQERPRFTKKNQEENRKIVAKTNQIQFKQNQPNKCQDIICKIFVGCIFLLALAGIIILMYLALTRKENNNQTLNKNENLAKNEKPKDIQSSEIWKKAQETLKKDEQPIVAKIQVPKKEPITTNEKGSTQVEPAQAWKKSEEALKKGTQPIVAKIQVPKKEQPIITKIQVPKKEQPIITKIQVPKKEQPIIAKIQVPKKEPITTNEKGSTQVEPAQAWKKSEEALKKGTQPIVAKIQVPKKEQPIIAKIQVPKKEQSIIIDQKGTTKVQPNDIWKITESKLTNTQNTLNHLFSL